MRNAASSSSMLDRYYVPEKIALGARTLTGPEAHHLAQVLRAKPGRQILLFDGAGGEYQAEVRQVGRRAVELEVLAHTSDDRMPRRRLCLAVSLPKGDRQRLLVEKCVELGVARLVPLVTERSVAEATPAALERMARNAIEACKQCGRNRLLEIAPPLEFARLLRESEEPLRLLAHPGGAPLGVAELGGEEPIVAAIGPEGGFSDAEAEAAEASGWRRIGLGPRLLRVETAAAVVAARCLGEG